MAQLNKRSFGFGSHYRPTWEKSRKKQIMDVMGEHYDFAVPAARWDRPAVVALRRLLESGSPLRAELADVGFTEH